MSHARALTPGAPPCPAGNVGRAEVLDPDALPAALEADWRALAEAVERSTCFAMPGYFDAWRRTLGRDVESRLLAVRGEGRLRGVMPVMRARVWRGPSCVPRHDYAPSDSAAVRSRWPRPLRLRQISTVVSMPATMLGPAPLCHATDTAAVTRSMATALVAMPGWDVIVLPSHQGPEQADWLAAFRDLGLHPWLHRLDRHIQGLDAVRPFEEILAGCKGKFRQNVRRARAEARADAVEITVFEGRAAVAHLGALAAVARASWKHDGRAGADVAIPYEGPQRLFFETLFAVEGNGLCPVLATAAADGEAIAAQLSVRHARTLTTLLTFHTGRSAAASPGMLLMGRMIDWAVEQGLSRVDYNATHQWLRYLADERRACDNLVVFAPSARGRVLGLISKVAQGAR